jgi:uncharacterized protein DUF4242
MPIFLDRHDVVEFSAEEIAKLHVKDLEVQGIYGVKFLTYWYDAERRTTFCLVDAPDKETADKVHAEAPRTRGQPNDRRGSVGRRGFSVASRIRRRQKGGRSTIQPSAPSCSRTWSVRPR